MRWLFSHGVCNTYEGYLSLPLPVLEDCRLLMEAENNARKLTEHRRG